MNGIRLKPLIVGVGLLCAGIWVAVTETKMLREYQQRAAVRTAKSEATIYNTRTAIAQSGKVLHYDVAYEFLADRDDGAKVSIADTSTQIAAKLRNQFLNGNIGQAATKPTDQEEPPQRNLAEAPAGKSYFAGQQQLTKEEFNRVSMGQAYAKYDPNDAKNCSLTVWRGPSTSKLYALAPFFSVLGAILIWVGVTGAMRKLSSEK